MPGLFSSKQPTKGTPLMPRKRPGIHNIHVKVAERNFRSLQEYCVAGAERLTASALVDLLMKIYIEDYLEPRMNRGESATWLAVNEDTPKVAAKVAHMVEPTAFEEPAND